MDLSYPIWLFFAAFFFYFAYAHWREGQVEMRPFSIRERAEAGSNPGPNPVLAKANEEFALEFNRYLDGVNRAAHNRHRAAAIGYGLSGMIAIASMFLLLARG